MKMTKKIVKEYHGFRALAPSKPKKYGAVRGRKRLPVHRLVEDRDEYGEPIVKVEACQPCVDDFPQIDLSLKNVLRHPELMSQSICASVSMDRVEMADFMANEVREKLNPKDYEESTSIPNGDISNQ